MAKTRWKTGVSVLIVLLVAGIPCARAGLATYVAEASSSVNNSNALLAVDEGQSAEILPGGCLVVQLPDDGVPVTYALESPPALIRIHLQGDANGQDTWLSLIDQLNDAIGWSGFTQAHMDSTHPAYDTAASVDGKKPGWVFIANDRIDFGVYWFWTPLNLETYRPWWSSVKYLKIENRSNYGGPGYSIFIDAIEVPPPPVAVDDAAWTEVNSFVKINVLANDSGIGISVNGVGPAGNGTVAISSDKKTVTYTPNPFSAGADSFTYTIVDSQDPPGTASATVTISMPATIAIDIKPGSYPNTINLGSNGLVPVAILSSDTLDATAISPQTVFLAGAGVAVRGKGNNTLATNEDVNGDGRLDLVLKMETQNLEPGTFQDGQAILKVFSPSDATSLIYEGWDQITIVPPN